VSVRVRPRVGGGYVLEAVQRFPGPPEEVFPFFADAGNLERITPPWLRFRIVAAPQRLDLGSLIDYRLRVRGVPVRWRTEITAWEPPHRFVDDQVRGPYRWWRHEHLFEDVDGGTRAVDRVDYAPPGGRVANRLLVQRDLERIFAYRQEVLRDVLGETG
jgi:ligand-binding SRPBCC domain-containing protein